MFCVAPVLVSFVSNKRIRWRFEEASPTALRKNWFRFYGGAFACIIAMIDFDKLLEVGRVILNAPPSGVLEQIIKDAAPACKMAFSQTVPNFLSSGLQAPCTSRLAYSTACISGIRRSSSPQSFLRSVPAA